MRPKIITIAHSDPPIFITRLDNIIVLYWIQL
jgi:hypothetical protein